MPPDENGFDKGQISQSIKDHERRLGENDKERTRMWQVIDKIRNRPPVWCTIAFGILLAFIGWLARAAFAGQMNSEQLKEVNRIVMELDTIITEAEKDVATLYDIVTPNALLKQTDKNVSRLKAELKGLTTVIENHKENTDEH